MWTEATRRQHSRDHLRYGSDLSDEEWQIIAPFMPPPAKTGRPREWTMREIVNGIFYVLRAGCPWRMLPKCFPPMTTVYGWFLRFRREGLFATINHHLVMADRERVGREASPSATSGCSRSPAPWPPAPPCSCWTSRPRGWRHGRSRRWASLSAGSGGWE